MHEMWCLSGKDSEVKGFEIFSQKICKAKSKHITLEIAFRVCDNIGNALA